MPVAPEPGPVVERVKKWLWRKWFLLGMVTTLNMPGWEPEERVCLGIFSLAPKVNSFGQERYSKTHEGVGHIIIPSLPTFQCCYTQKTSKVCVQHCRAWPWYITGQGMRLVLL